MQRPVSDRPIDTAPLQRVIDMFAAMSAAILEGVLDGPALAKLKKCASEIERVSKELRRTALSNMKGSALARLRTDRAYRARVRAELGGPHVIARWRERLRASNFPRQIELRAARAEALKQLKTNPDIGCPPDNGAADFDRKAARPPREKKPVKTCGAGLFRLAPVPIWLESSSVRPRLAGQQGARKASSGAVRRLYAPIPLMPEDIGGDLGADDIGPDDLGPQTEFIKPIDIPRVDISIEDGPIEDGPDPFSNSQRITAEEKKHWQWNEHCQEYFPPLEPEPNFGPNPNFEPEPPPRREAGVPFVRRI